MNNNKINALKRIKKKHKAEIKALSAENMELRVASLKKDIIINSYPHQSREVLERIIVLAKSHLLARKDLNNPSY